MSDVLSHEQKVRRIADCIAGNTAASYAYYYRWDKYGGYEIIHRVAENPTDTGIQTRIAHFQHESAARHFVENKRAEFLAELILKTLEATNE